MTFEPLPPIPHETANSRRRFQPPSPDSVPAGLYSVRPDHSYNPGLRYIRNSNPSELLIFIDSFCTDEGTPNARAGYAVKFSPLDGYSLRLTVDVPETRMSALIEAAFMALCYHEWDVGGFDTLVIASSYTPFIDTVCDQLWRWKSNGWKESGATIPNQAPWEMLDRELGKWDNDGVQVCFWQIPEPCHRKVSKLAQNGAKEEREVEEGDTYVIEYELGDLARTCRAKGIAYDSDFEEPTYQFLSEEEVGTQLVDHLHLNAADGRVRVLPAGGGFPVRAVTLR
ncbi:MAG: hypothetical protein Q9182_005185 [Xanthomendoza sp. 2 TL-2023]